ncbi:MAG: DUF4136 domain-containing protein [Bacteroidetes bacterium]|nr:DUF4136 domain-containing protein [Bacteroidota bacterium]MDA1121475.1 DUF4136 domain-containing protein [Bacteroidota bacterium]
MSIKTIIILSIIGISTGCAPVLVTHDVGTNVDFGNYRTFYCWEYLDDFDPLSKEYDNEVNRELIMNALRFEMEKLGYGYEHDNPDITVTVDFHVVIEQRVEVVWEESPFNWQSHDHSAYPAHYKYGTLIIHLVDYSDGQLIWQGTASSILGDPKNAKKTIDKAVAKIFNQYEFRAAH